MALNVTAISIAPAFLGATFATASTAEYVSLGFLGYAPPPPASRRCFTASVRARGVRCQRGVEHHDWPGGTSPLGCGTSAARMLAPVQV